MSITPVTFSVPGLPARFGGYSNSSASSLDSGLIDGPLIGNCYVITGIDVSAHGITAVSMTAWFEVNAIRTYFASYNYASDGAREALIGSWRGAIPLTTGDTFKAGLGTGLAASLGLMIWGQSVPLPGSPII